MSSSLDLPSMRLGEPQLDLVEHFAELKRPNPADYIADEDHSLQTKANEDVRLLLKNSKKNAIRQSTEEAPALIDLETKPGADAGSPIVDLTLDTGENSLSDNNHCSPHNNEHERIRQEAYRRANKDDGDDDTPPWMRFIGQSPSLTAPLVDWRVALSEMKESMDFFSHLHEEMNALCMWLEPTPEELLLRQRVLARVKVVCQLLWPDCIVSTFGSYYTGLTLPNGDVDVNLKTAYVGPGDSVRALRLLTLCMNKLGMAYALEVIAGARVPIVKLVDAETGVSVDISFNTDSALSTSRYILENIKLYPWLRPLVMLLKLYLQQRNLNETFRGGVGSYLLFCLVLSFLQQHRLCHSEAFRDRANLGHLLFDFFQLYGRDFNYESTGISVNGGGCYFMKTRYDWFNRERPWLLSMESPLATELDIGKSSYEIRTVRNAFRQSFLNLAELHRMWTSGHFPREKSLLTGASIIFPSDPLLRNRVRVPSKYHGDTPLEKSPWWKGIRPLLGLPVGAPRPPPEIPESILTQVSQELEAIYARGLNAGLLGDPAIGRQRAAHNNYHYRHAEPASKRRRVK